MKIYRIENIIKMLTTMIPLLVLIFVTHVKALEPPTHMAINEFITDKNVTFNGFSLHNYLQTEIGIQSGVNASFKNKQIYEWLRDGGASEDIFIRPLNHFHNPITDTGLTVWIGAPPENPPSTGRSCQEAHRAFPETTPGTTHGYTTVWAIGADSKIL